MPIITCHNKQFSIPYDKHNVTSEYIKDIVTLSGDVDVVIPIPDKYCIVINSYIEFLTGESKNQSPITSRNKLLLGFQLNTLFIDNSYFNYLVTQVFNNWSYMCNIVYNNFNNDLQWLFFIYCPHDFIPKYLLHNESFMTQWNKFNRNTIINVNHTSEVYYNNVETNEKNGKVVKTYHTVHGKEVGYKEEIVYYKNSNYINSKRHYVDGKPDGVQRRWYNNDQHTLKYEQHYVDGKLDGVWREWYDNNQHTLKSEGNWFDSKKHGHWIEYNGNGNIISDDVYVNGIKQN